MSDLRRFDLHEPWCPDNCLIGATAEDLLECFEGTDFVTKEQLDAMKVDDSLELGVDKDWTLYRVEDAKEKTDG